MITLPLVGFELDMILEQRNEGYLGKQTETGVRAAPQDPVV